MPTALVFTLCVTAVVAVSCIEWFHNKEQLQQRVDAAAVAMALELDHQLVENQEALARMALRWKHSGGTPRYEWERDAEAHVNDLPGFDSLVRLDRSGGDPWTVPAMDPRPIQQAAAALLDQRDADAPLPRVMALSLPDGHSIHCFVQRLSDRSGGIDGLLIGPIDERQLLSSAMESMLGWEGLAATFLCRDRVMYRSEPQPAPGESPVGSTELKIGDLSWTVSVSPLPRLLAQWRLPQPMLVLGGGLIASLLLTLCVHSMRVAAARAREQDLLNHQLEQLNRTLDEKISHRTEQLEQKNQELEQFIYSVSHDLKSPLVTIQGYIRHLSNNVKAHRFEKLDDFTRRIERAAGRMKENIGNLLRMSRMVTGPGDVQTVDPNRLLIEALADIEGSVDELGAIVRVQPNLPLIDADPTRLAEVFANLLGNALKYAGQDRQPIVEVTGEVLDGAVRFAVADNGPGIDLADQEKVFDLFNRLGGVGETEGSGVGLAIVKRVMVGMGGRVWIESPRLDTGGGARFWLSFPRPAAVRDQAA